MISCERALPEDFSVCVRSVRFMVPLSGGLKKRSAVRSKASAVGPNWEANVLLNGA